MLKKKRAMDNTGTRTLPDWLTKTEQFTLPEPQTKRRKTDGFIEKTLAGISAIIEEAVFSQKYASSSGLLQAMDARFKLISVLMLLLAVGFAHSIGLLIALNVLALLMALASRITLSFFIRRVWFFIPLYTGIVVFPAIFSFITPGKPLFSAGSAIITEQGVKAAFMIITRVGASVSFAVLLMLTTKWQDLMRALRALYIPQTFILTTEMTYRYIFLLLRIVDDMHLARKSRVLQRTSGSENRDWIASRIGVLLKKSQGLSEHVYLAMLSRGYTGEARTLQPGKAGIADLGVLSFSLLVLVAVIILNWY